MTERSITWRVLAPVSLSLALGATALAAPSPRTVTVRRGDSLWAIGQRSGVSVAQLQRWNKLKGSIIYKGQKLLVTPPPPPGLPYAVALSKKPLLGVAVKVVHVNLAKASIRVSPVFASAGLGTGVKLEQLAKRPNTLAVINGGYFHPTSFMPAGDLVVNGRYIYSGKLTTAITLTRDNRAAVTQWSPVQTVSWRGFQTVIANGPYVLRAGKVVVQPRAEGYRDAAVWGRAARSAIGIVDERHIFFLSTRVPLTLSELAKVMQRAGARDGITLDGGSSVGLAWKGEVLIPPARKIAYGIAVETTGK